MGQNKVGPRVTCPQNLVRTHIMLRSRAHMALKKGWLIIVPDV